MSPAPNHINCKWGFYGSIRVRVRHSDTGRITHQRWDFCRTHFDFFLERDGKEFYAWYKDKPFKKAHVLDFELIAAI